MLDDQIFETVVNYTPLVSIDILLKKNNKILLGRRVNKPAQGYFFSIGGRIHKNETMITAMNRIASIELNIDLEYSPEFIGVFEHFYDEGIFKDLSTHYVNIAYEYEVTELPDLPTEQHSEYKWFEIDELLKSAQVHQYTKDYFRY